MLSEFFWTKLIKILAFFRDLSVQSRVDNINYVDYDDDVETYPFTGLVLSSAMIFRLPYISDFTDILIVGNAKVDVDVDVSGNAL